ncbi:MAG: hypothetical protein ABSE46_20280 [Terracidiphilus sp.]|jgi:hypothetical protein
MVKTKAHKTIRVYGVYDGPQWAVNYGELLPGSGTGEEVPRLFQALGEKLPFEALAEVRKHLKKEGIRRTGVYIAHDSMTYARYIGRGNIFQRLAAHKNSLELKYFSFYVVEEKTQEREIETLLIRAAGPLLQFNTKKKRLTLSVGNISDYEAGTLFFERRYKRGAKRRHA